MRIVCRDLTELAMAAVSKAQESHPDAALLVGGAQLDIEHADDGIIAVLKTVRAELDIDLVRSALEAFLSGAPESGVEVVADMERLFQQQQRMLIRLCREQLIKDGMTPEQAELEAMYLASRFSDIRAGSVFGHVQMEHVTVLCEHILNNTEEVVVRVRRRICSSGDWDGLVNIEVLESSLDRKAKEDR